MSRSKGYKAARAFIQDNPSASDLRVAAEAPSTADEAQEARYDLGSRDTWPEAKADEAAPAPATEQAEEATEKEAAPAADASTGTDAAPAADASTSTGATKED